MLHINEKFKRPRVIGILFCLVLCSSLGACAEPKASEVIISSVPSADGKNKAMLVRRHLHAPRHTTNLMYLIVIPSSEKPEAAIKRMKESSAFVATFASKVELRWISNDTLSVVCNSCPWEDIDIIERSDRLESTKIVYEGFPKDTDD